MINRYITTKSGFAHWCPGCRAPHILPADRGWEYSVRDGLMTATPSFKHTIRDGKVCHYHLTKDRLLFLDDCWHALAAVTVDVPEFPDSERWPSD